MKAFLLGRNGGLWPTDRVSADVVAKQSGKDGMWERKEARNVKHHQKYWCLVNLCAEHCDYTPEQISDIFKLRAGITTQSWLRDGTIVQHPGSIAFAKMDQAAFEEFYERVLDVVAKDIIPNVNRADLERELMEFLK